MKLSIRTALITGAASGLGRAVALMLGARGVYVYALDRDADGVSAAVAEIQRGGGKAEPLVADVGRAASITSAFQTVVARGDALEAVVTCSAVIDKTRILDLTAEDWDRVMAVNLRGTFLCVQHALRTMIPRNFGRIVTVASDAGKRGGGRLSTSAYAASKGGVILFTRSIARELASAESQIRINCICPGPMTTRMHDQLSEADQERVVKTVPLGRFARPEEVAAAIVFLLSDEASFVYGETMSVDGGVLMD